MIAKCYMAAKSKMKTICSIAVSQAVFDLSAQYHQKLYHQVNAPVLAIWLSIKDSVRPNLINLQPYYSLTALLICCGWVFLISDQFLSSASVPLEAPIRHTGLIHSSLLAWRYVFSIPEEIMQISQKVYWIRLLQLMNACIVTASAQNRSWKT